MMAGRGKDNTPEHKSDRHLTTRRGFVAATSLGAVSLYGLWAANGAAPLRFWAGNAGNAPAEPAAAGHESHGGAPGADIDGFRRLTEEFIARHRQDDGAVLVEPASVRQSSAGDEHAAHHGGGAATTRFDNDAGPAEVLIAAQQWSFEPATIRLRAAATYRFKLMAIDTAHGASLQLGSTGYIIRLPRGVLVERELTFAEPGDYLLYCTVYCGEAHQYMSGRLQVL